MQRRDFFSLSSVAAGALLPGLPVLSSDVTSSGKSHVFDIRDTGAVADGRTLNTAFIQASLDMAFRSGGGTVYVPPGTFLTGGLVLQSRVTLHLESGAVLLGSTRFEDYAPQPGPSAEGDANSHHLLFARNADDVALTGLGVIDGQGPSYWTKLDRPQPAPEDMWEDVVAFDYKATPRRPAPMLEFVECRNLRIEGVTLRNAPSWTMRTVACDSVFIRGMRVRNPVYGPNTDGMDISSSSNVFISDCDIACGDDAICLKSENPYGANVANKNITITNCVLTTCCNGFKIGTATHGRFENIVFSNSVIYNDNVPINQRVIAGLAIEMVDGGSVDGVLITNIRMRNVRTPIFVRLGERRGGRESTLSNVVIRGIDATGVLYPSSITGLPSHPVNGVTLSDISMQSDEPGLEAWTKNLVPEREKSYPEARMFGRLPAHGLYVRHARRIRLSNVELIASAAEQRPALVCDDVQDIQISGLRAAAPHSKQPIVSLTDVDGAFLHGSKLQQPRGYIVEVKGAASANILLQDQRLTGPARDVDVAAEVAANAVTAR